jgi:transcriptional regulator with XRE-family HTH domain
MLNSALQASELPRRLRAARRARRLTQAALAAATGVSRVTIARIESGERHNLRLETLARLQRALGPELDAARANVGSAMHERRLARALARERRLDARRRHAVLAVRLCVMPPREAAAAISRARAVVERWRRKRLCGEPYIARWRAMLAGSPKRVATKLLQFDEWTDALLQNTPWSFALEPPAAAED